MSRYGPAPQYLPASAVAALMAVFSVWCGLQWPLALIPAALFVLSSAVLCFLGTRPTIEVSDRTLRIGSHRFRWRDVERIDSTAWTSPLILALDLRGGRRVRLIYPGDVESGEKLLHQMGRRARWAMIDGLPYREYWGETLSTKEDPVRSTNLRYRLLRPEDEAEVEEMFQRLRAVGRPDNQSSSEDHQD